MVDRDRGWKQGYTKDPLRREQMHFHSSPTIASLDMKKGEKGKKGNDVKNILCKDPSN